jgi:hypothetical protein
MSLIKRRKRCETRRYPSPTPLAKVIASAAGKNSSRADGESQRLFAIELPTASSRESSTTSLRHPLLTARS